jgi:hypothetical protein
MTPRRAASLALVAGLALAACSSSGSDAGTELVTTTAPAAATSSPDAVTLAPTTVAGPDGDTFADPQGEYTIVTGPDWSDRTADASSGGIELWQVAPAANGFASNVNVVTEKVQGVDMDTYLDASIKNLGTLTVIDTDVVAGADGRERGVVEYEGTVPGADRPFHFLAVIDLGETLAAIVTFTAEDAVFASLRTEVEPYLMTLRAN